MIRDTWVTAAVLMGTLASGGAAYAADAQTNDQTTNPPSRQTNSAIKLDQVKVAANKPDNAADNTTTVSQDDIDTYGGYKLDDILRSVAGVFTATGADQPGVAVNIRGFEGEGRVNMMVDGVRQDFRFTNHDAEGLTYVDPNLLAGIDIDRGEVITTGGGGLTGSVNFRTLNVDDILRDGQTKGVLGRITWGSNGEGFSEMLSAAAKYDKVGIAGAISKRDSQDYKDADGNSVADTQQNLTSGLFKVNAALTDDQQLGLGAVIYHNDFFADSYGQTVMNNTYTANYHYDPNNDLVDLHVNGYYNHLTMKYTSGTGSYVGRTITDNGSGFDVSNTSVFSLDQVRLHSVNGVEFFHDDAKSQNGGVNPANGRSNTGGVFTEDTFTYGRFDLTPGLRYSFYTLNGNGTPSTKYGSYSIDTYDGEIDPKITLAAHVTDWLQPYVTFSRSMRAPSVQETMLGGDHPGTVSASFIPNPTLKPEKDLGWEFGAKIRKQDLLTQGDALTLHADYYMMDVDNYIAAAYLSASRAYEYANVDGTSHVNGIELEGNYDTGWGFASLSYTHSDSDLPRQTYGMGLSQYLPDDMVTVTGGLRFLDRAMTVGARYSYIDGGLQVGSKYQYTTNNTDYGLVDTFVSYKVTDDLSVSGKVTNVANEKYIPFLSSTVTDYGPGRTFYLTTEFRF